MSRATPRRVYLDTSFYLAARLGDLRVTAHLAALASAHYCSSVLLLIEAERNLIRLQRSGQLSAADYAVLRAQLHDDRALFLLRDVTIDLCLNGTYPPVRLPKSLDCIHLRTAVWFREHGGLDQFYTLDQAQADAARDFGLSVVCNT